ncbi:MAG: OmpA family protein, partial [Bacteroidota bacterium]
MKVFFTAILCICSLFIFGQQDSVTNEDGKVKKNGFLSSRTLDEDGNPLSVQIDVVDNTSNQVIQTSQSSRIGFSRISLPSGNYNVIFSKPGYLFHSVHVVILDSAGYDKKLKNIVLQKVEIGKNTVLNNVAFEQDQSVLKEDSFLDLERVLALMNEIVSLQIEITGNSEDGVTESDKAKLAEQRAKVLMDYLVSKGIDRGRLKYKEYDKFEPIAIVDGKEENKDKISLKVLNVDTPTPEPVEEVKDPVVEEKQEENVVVAGEEPVQEVKEPVVEAKQDENVVVTGEEPVQEVKEPVVEEKQEEKAVVAEEPVQEVKEPVVEEKQEEKA